MRPSPRAASALSAVLAAAVAVVSPAHGDSKTDNYKKFVKTAEDIVKERKIDRLRDAIKVLEDAVKLNVDNHAKKGIEYCKLMIEGNEAFKSRKYAAAQSKWEAAARVYNWGPMADGAAAKLAKAAEYKEGMAMGRAAMARKEHGLAVVSFGKALSGKRDDPAAKELKKEAEARHAVDIGDREMAAKHYAKAVENHRGALLMYESKVPEAKGKLAKASMMLGMELREDKKFAEAAQAFRNAKDLMPSEGLYKFLIFETAGLEYLANDKPADAEKAFAECVKLFPGNKASAFYKFYAEGLREMKAKNWGLAAVAFDSALKFDPGDSSLKAKAKDLYDDAIEEAKK